MAQITSYLTMTLTARQKTTGKANHFVHVCELAIL